MDKLIFKSHGASDLGLVREHNEDYYGLDKEQGLFIVADGLGGHQAGEVASKLATEAVLNFFKHTPKKESSQPVTDKNINRLIQKAHQVILDLSSEDDSLKGMGTTIVFGIFSPPHSFYLANIGDSRAYLYRDKKLQLLTQDHSVVAQLVSQGKITPQEAKTHNLRNIVTQALGIEIGMGCNQRKIDLEDKDLIILCSDGLWDMLSDKAIEEIASKENNPEKLCSDLIEAAKKEGGQDNITVIVILVNKPKEKQGAEAFAQVQITKEEG